MTEDFNKDSLKESYSSAMSSTSSSAASTGTVDIRLHILDCAEDCFVAVSSFELKLRMGLVNAIGVSFALLGCALPIVAPITQETRGEKNPMRTWLLSLTFVLPLLSGGAIASVEKGLEIATRMDERDVGWTDSRSKLTMVLRNKRGQETTRAMRGANLEVQGDGDKSLTIFDNPKDVKGTAFLSHTHSTKPDDQWLFLPALKRVKRISSANKSGPFVGSEFAYEDLTSQELDKYTYNWLRDEDLNGKPVYVIERTPTYKHSGYTRQVVWIDKNMYQAVKVEYYDRKNSLLKTLDISDFSKYLDKFWRPARMHMVNHQTGKSTELTFSDYKFKTGLTNRDFDRNSLKRAR